VLTEEIVSLDCPYCQGNITKLLSWFKQTYSTCPVCDGGLTAGQFAPLVEELGQAFDASVDEMIRGESSGACAKGRGCGSGACSQ